MSAGKIGCLALYAVLILVALTQGSSDMGMVAGGILLALAVSHLIEMAMYYRLCQQSAGSLGGNLFQVFVFGYFHMVEMKAQQRESAREKAP